MMVCSFDGKKYVDYTLTEICVNNFKVKLVIIKIKRVFALFWLPETAVYLFI